MPLLQLWSTSSVAVDQFTVEQVVATAGDGVLRDGSLCCQELREYLSQISSSKLAEYVEQCLSGPFPKGGMVLQDLVNELGRRLEYRATNGRYKGTTNAVGFDGIWVSPEGHSIVVEVKTTDAYRVSLDTIVRYRSRLVASDQMTQTSSILIVVGREDTGELEAQIRGSRHAWDIRLISADALIKLVELKEGAEGLEIGQKIRSLLTPMEFTRLDELIDVMFTTAKDVETGIGSEAVEVETENVKSSDKVTVEDRKGTWNLTDPSLLNAKRTQIVIAIARRENTSLIKKSRALFWSANHDIRVACTVSKRHTGRSVLYWYAYHPRWAEFLSQSERAFFVLGCMDLSRGNRSHPPWVMGVEQQGRAGVAVPFWQRR